MFNGTGVAKDEARAASLFRRAALRGSPIAQNRLARILSLGRGAPANPAEAIKWHLIAKAGGNGDPYLDQFAAQQTPEIRAAAEAGGAAMARRPAGEILNPVACRADRPTLTRHRRRPMHMTPPALESSPLRDDRPSSRCNVMLRSALLNVMTAAARKAGRSLKRDFGEVEHLQVSLKGPANFVTAADRRTEEMLLAELTKARPGYGFLGEEGGRQAGDDKSHCWIVDPLDGTTNFLHGIPQFAISIGLEREGVIVAGVIYNPANEELFTAERGKGAFLNDQRLRVAARRRMADAVVACGLPHFGRGDLAFVPPGIRRRPGARRRPAPVRRRRARPRLGRGRPFRRLLGARPFALGHGGRHPDGARGRRLRHRSRRRGRHFHQETDCRRQRVPPPRFDRLPQGGGHSVEAGPADRDGRPQVSDTLHGHGMAWGRALCCLVSRNDPISHDPLQQQQPLVRSAREYRGISVRSDYPPPYFVNSGQSDCFRRTKHSSMICGAELDIDPFKVSSPRIFLVRMLVFVVLGLLLVIILNRQIWAAFLANPGLNTLIIGVLLIGIVLAFRQVIRLFPEIAWVNSFRLADPGLAVERPPVLLAPMAAILGDRGGPHGDFIADDAEPA